MAQPELEIGGLDIKAHLVGEWAGTRNNLRNNLPQISFRNRGETFLETPAQMYSKNIGGQHFG